MIEITAALIKELRLRTGVSFLECKRALLEENGNIELSVDNLRKSGKMHAEKRTHKITKQGAIFLKIHSSVGAILELNCETDFVSKDDLFTYLGNEIISISLLKKIQNINDLKKIFEEKRTDLLLKVGENIKIRRFHYMTGKNITSYLHGGRIGVLVSSNDSNNKILKNIAMHIAASKPEYLNPEDVPSTIFNREYQIQLELSKKLKKSSLILEKIVQGRMKKFIDNISLTKQSFIMNPSETVGEVLIKNKVSITSFIRFEVGELINSYK